MLDAAAIAAEIGRTHRTPAVILAFRRLCHSEGLVKLGEIRKQPPMDIPEDLARFNTLPVTARNNYIAVLSERMPALLEMVEASPLNRWEKGSEKSGVITYGANTLL